LTGFRHPEEADVIDETEDRGSVYTGVWPLFAMFAAVLCVATALALVGIDGTVPGLVLAGLLLVGVLVGVVVYALRLTEDAEEDEEPDVTILAGSARHSAI
jgi:hypothetical protein